MVSLFTVILFSLIGSVFSLIGGFVLLGNKKSAKNLALYATPFAAGALLAAAFGDLLPEAVESTDAHEALKLALIGILIFFMLEKFLHWFHHHHEHDKKQNEPVVALIILGDILHNFIDGIAIAAGFLVDLPTGIAVTVAVAAHEIPQEIGDFGLLLANGLKKKSVIRINMLSALATVAGAALFYTIGQESSFDITILLGLVGGFFIYIAASDIIPTIHATDKKLAGPQTILLLAGVLIVFSLTSALHGVIDSQSSDHSHSEGEMSHMHEKIDLTGLGELAPQIEIEVIEDAKSGYNLYIDLINFEFNAQNVNQEDINYFDGHAHLYVNGEKITRLYSTAYYLGELKSGDEVRVSLNSDDHKDLYIGDQPIEATFIIGVGASDHSHGHSDDAHSH